MTALDFQNTNTGSTKLNYDDTSANDFVVTLPHKTCTLASVEGTTTNDNALAGQIGEYISSTVLAASAISIATSTVTVITSIGLTAGDWDVTGRVGFISSGTTSVTRLNSMINTSVAISNDLEAINQYVYVPSSVINTPGNGEIHIPCGGARISIAVPTTVYLLALGTFTASTLSAHGIISARRVR